MSSARLRTAIALVAGLSVLAACAEPDQILPGQREDIRGVQAVAPPPAAPVDRAIRLPSQAVNSSWEAPIGSTRAANAALSSAPQVAWSVKVGAGNSLRNRISSAPIAGGGLIYTQDALSAVTAVTPQGAVAWTRDVAETLGEKVKVSGGGMTYDDGALYVTTNYGALIAMDARSGDVRWIQRLGATGSGSPLVRGGLVYVLAGDDSVWALRSKDGRIAWQLDGTSTITNILGAPAPVWTGSLVVFAFGSGDLTATFPQGGLVRWTAAVTGQRNGVAVARISDVTGAPVVSGNRIYAGNHSGRTVALDAQSGERLWTTPYGALDPVWPVGGSIFAVSDTNNLLRINASDGSVIWAAELPGFVKDKPRQRGKQYANFGPILAGGNLIVTSTDGLIRFFDPASGALRRTVEIPSGAASGAIVVDRTMYVLNTKGDLYAFR